MTNEKIVSVLAALKTRGYKGSHGRIGIIGGCEQYTGAPYYAAMAALRGGAELATVFTSPSAAIPIKCYSPELMVVPSYDMTEWTNRLHVVIIGPGLGRNTGDLVPNVVRSVNLPMVIDADGLFSIQSCLGDVLHRPNQQPLLLTPNQPEFERLIDHASSQGLLQVDQNETRTNKVQKLAGALKCTVLLKGEHDIVACSSNAVSCNEIGSNRRSGGQGDLLTGLVSAHYHLATMTGEPKTEAFMTAGITGSTMLKQAAKLAFEKTSYSTLSTDILSCIPDIMKAYLDTS